MRKPYYVRYWSSVMGKGGLQNGSGGAGELLPVQKVGDGKSLSHPEGGGGGAQKVLG